MKDKEDYMEEKTFLGPLSLTKTILLAVCMLSLVVIRLFSPVPEWSMPLTLGVILVTTFLIFKR